MEALVVASFAVVALLVVSPSALPLQVASPLPPALNVQPASPLFVGRSQYPCVLHAVRWLFSVVSILEPSVIVLVARVVAMSIAMVVV